jgi:hypothetical protein
MQRLFPVLSENLVTFDCQFVKTFSGLSHFYEVSRDSGSRHKDIDVVLKSQECAVLQEYHFPPVQAGL